jgi:nucleoside-diphosphate-sugar epimerase
VVREVCTAGGRPELEPDVLGKGTPEGEIDRQWLDFSRLRELSGWEPQVSLDEGLARAIEWYRANPQSLYA